MAAYLTSNVEWVSSVSALYESKVKLFFFHHRKKLKGREDDYGYDYFQYQTKNCFVMQMPNRTSHTTHLDTANYYCSHLHRF